MIQGSVFKTTLIIVLVAVITFLHFSTGEQEVELHGLYQHLYYIPIILAGFWFRIKGGILASLGITGCYIFYYGSHPVHEFNLYSEMVIYNIVGIVTGVLSLMEKKQREKSEKTAEDLSRAYQKLQTTFEQLRQADRLAALGELAAGLAHEIRNPLSSINGAIDILESEFNKENPKYEFVEVIKVEVERLNTLVSEFVRFARPPEPELRDADINEIVDSVVRLTFKKAEQQKVKVISELSEALPNIFVDSEQIKQVLLNIVINGIQAMPYGGKLLIKTNDRNGSIEVSVSDEGVGIESEKLSRVFDPFFTTKEDGTGLGLSISYQLIKKHGGDIAVHLNPDRGLTFTLRIPRREQ
ncbi:MAG: sensor histidine kinase [Deltaproteobacteria bacterium]|nr:sensor histidine kinase [Deltaproteobacteria bacterium]